MLSVDQIKTLIDNDRVSSAKKQARVGRRYYEADHDIKDRRIFFVDGEGNLKEDLTKANTRISHAFFTEIVDQTVQYMLSGDGAFIRSDNPELQTELDTYFNENEDFVAELYEALTNCISLGVGHMHAYMNEETERTAFKSADSLGVIEVRANETDEHCAYVIFVELDHITADGKKIKRIQAWSDKEVAFFVQEDDGKIEEDKGEKLNPRPHILWHEDGTEELEFDDYGCIPFFALENNSKRRSDLKPIKDLIDDYDLMNAGLSNNIEDTSEALYVVRGFQGDNLDELMQNIKAKKHIGVDDDGGVDIQTVTVPVEARKAKMEIDEKNIYRFGFGLNTAGLKDTAATTNIAIKTAYSLLDLKTNKLIIKTKRFLRKLVKVVLNEINEDKGTDYQPSDVYFHFEPEVMTNAMENAQIELTEAQRKQTEINTLLNIAAQLDNETIMQLICEQLEVDFEEIKDKLPALDEPDPYNAQSALDVPTVATIEDGGGVIE